VLWLQTSARGVGGGGSPAEGVKSAAAAGFVRRAGAAASHGNVVSWDRASPAADVNIRAVKC
jgi:hypothetical protein